MIRFFDILFSLLGLVLLSPVIVILWFVGWRDTGSAFFVQERVGRYQKPFNLIKFRSMKVGTASTDTHLVDSRAITPWGHFLRRSKLDELPQLINVLSGQMSLVGPRPCLFTQVQLCELRSLAGVFEVRPGITGLAQLNDIDMSMPEQLTQTDASMIAQMSVKLYFSCIIQTILGKGRGDRIRP